MRMFGGMSPPEAAQKRCQFQQQVYNGQLTGQFNLSNLIVMNWEEEPLSGGL